MILEFCIIFILLLGYTYVKYSKVTSKLSMSIDNGKVLNGYMFL